MRAICCQVVDAYTSALLDRQAYTEAAALSPRLLAGSDAKRWEQWAFLFAQARHLPDLAPYLPMDKPRLR
jgi:vacuolar protein sorting-associated protein 41